MTLLVITGLAGEAAPADGGRGVARVQALKRQVQDLVVLEADGTRRSEFAVGLAAVLTDAARHEPRSVVLLVDADVDQVERIQPLTEKLELPLLWWREEPPSPEVVAALRRSIAGIVTAGSGASKEPNWLWDVGAGIDLTAVRMIETFPNRPPLRVVAFPPAPGPDLDSLVRAIAIARGLAVDVHLSVALRASTTPAGAARELDTHVESLALRRSVRVSIVDTMESAPQMLADAHAFVDVGDDSRALAVEAIVAMAHGRPVLSARHQLAPLLDMAPLPLRFPAGDARGLAERMQSLDAAWKDELSLTGRALAEVVFREHSVTRWAERVASVVRSVTAEPHPGSGRPVDIAVADRTSD